MPFLSTSSAIALVQQCNFMRLTQTHYTFLVKTKLKEKLEHGFCYCLSAFLKIAFPDKLTQLSQSCSLKGLL